MLRAILIENIIAASVGLFMSFIFFTLRIDFFQTEREKQYALIISGFSLITGLMGISNHLFLLSGKESFSFVRNLLISAETIVLLHFINDELKNKKLRIFSLFGLLSAMLFIPNLPVSKIISSTAMALFLMASGVLLIKNNMFPFKEHSKVFKFFAVMALINSSLFFLSHLFLSPTDAEFAVNPVRFFWIYDISLLYIVLREFITTSQEIEKSIASTMLMQEIIRSSIEDSLVFLINAIEAKDPYTKGHSERVANYAVALARRLKIKPEHIRIIEQGGLLHDIGKVGVRIDILSKPGKLTEEEFTHIKNHTIWGSEILKTSEDLRRFEPFARSHHERYDGKGYPDGIPAEKLPVWIRIITLADAYDAMTSNRPYRASLAVEEAARRIKNASGTQFDPELSKEFIHLISLMES